MKGKLKMNLCSRRHREVCYEDEPCPVCEIRDDMIDLQDEIDSLESEESDA